MDKRKKKLLQKKYEVKEKLYDYCMRVRVDRGCVGCPLDSLNICNKDIMRDVDIRRLLKVAEKIDEVMQSERVEP